jgi:hypothetical protein
VCVCVRARQRERERERETVVGLRYYVHHLDVFILIYTFVVVILHIST